MIWLLLLAAAPCTPPGPDASVKVSFKAGSTIEELRRFVAATACEEWTLAEGAGKRALKLAIEGEVTGRQLPALVRLLAESAGVPAPAPRVEAVCPASVAAAIVPVDPWTRKVPLGIRSRLFDCAVQQMRVVPNLKDGKTQGFKLFAIRAGSILEALGFQSTDVVLSVNGAELSTPDQAVEAYAKLQDAAEVKFAVLRKGEPRTITWLSR